MKKKQLLAANTILLKLLRELREAKNLTQTQIANQIGCPQSYVSKYEVGERRLTFVEVAFICKALGVKLDEFTAIFSDRVQNSGQKTDKATDLL